MFYAAQMSPKVAIIVEHPRKPDWLPHAAGSWLVPELQHAASLPASLSVHIDQCMFGAPSKKPTTLLCFQCTRIQWLTSMQHTLATGGTNMQLFRVVWTVPEFLA